MAVNPKIVSLWSDTQSKDKFVCSGWLLDSRHILTVRHGVESLETVFVALLDGVAERREATVLRLHPKRDAALLALDAQLDFTIPAPGVLAKHQALQNRTVAVHAISPTLEVPSAQIFGNYAIGSYVEGDRSWVLAPENARGHSGGVVTCEGVVVGLVWARAGSDPHCYATSTHVLFTWIQKILPGVLRTETIPTHANAAEPSVSADPMPPKTVPTNGKVPKKKYAKPRAMVNGSRGRLTVQEVRHCHQGLISALKSAIRPTGLFPSRPTDATTSPTVSALCALALHEFDETQSVAQSVVGKLVAVSRNLAGDAGAWPAQSGPIPHTVGTAWPLFAVARVLPHLLGDAQLQQSISWLAKGARSPRSGWGFHRRQAPDSFPTAYALNALLAVQGCRQAAEFSREIKMDMQDAIREAQHFLLGAARGNRARGEIYWNGDSNVESEVCLATTTMCYHVLAKDPGDPSSTISLMRAARLSLERICDGLKTHSLNINEVEVVLPCRRLRTATWPVRHVTDGINYTYAFFTPLIALTILELVRDKSVRNKNAVFRDCCQLFVRWIVEAAQKAQGSLLSVPGQGPTVWATAQGALVLGRVTKAAEWL